MQFTPLSLSLSAQQIDGEPIDLTPDMPVELTTADTIVFNGTTNRGDELETDEINYYWTLVDDQGQTVATYEGQIFAFNHNNPGDYSLEVLADQGCYSEIEKTAIRIEQAVSSTELLETSDQISIYPNPNTGQFSLQAPTELLSQITSLQLYTTTGQLIKQKTYSGQEININHLPTATYLLHIHTTKNQTITLPIIKK